MGTASFVTCPKCKKTHDCGYGSYTSHGFRVSDALKEHEGHEAVDWQSDWAWLEGDDLVMQSFAGWDVWIPGAAKFEQVEEE